MCSSAYTDIFKADYFRDLEVIFRRIKIFFNLYFSIWFAFAKFPEQLALMLSQLFEISEK